MGSLSFSWMEVPMMGSDSVNWIELSVPSSTGQLHATAASASHPLTPPSEDAASCFLLGDPPVYLIWRICSTVPHLLELVEVCPCKEFPRIGLRINFPDALCPFTYILKNEIEYSSGVLFILYVLTVSGVVYTVKLRDFNIYLKNPIFQLNEIMEFNLEINDLNSGSITSIAATAQSLVIGRSDGSVGCFQLGMTDKNLPCFVCELRDDSGFGRLWGFISRARIVGVEVQDLVIFEFQRRKFVCVLHFNGNLCVWDLSDHNRVFSQTLNTSMVTGETIFTKLWVGETDNNEMSVLPLAVLLRGTDEVSLETMLIYKFHFRLMSKLLYLDPSVHSIPLEVGKLIAVVLTSKNMLVLKESGLRSYGLSHTHGLEGICHLQEAVVADHLFQCSDHSSYSSDDLFQIIHSIQSSRKDQVETASLLSSIFLRRLLNPRVYHKTVIRAIFQDYNKHWTDYEFQSLTADDLKKEILLLIEQEGLVGNLTSIYYCWKNFCSKYFHIWCKNNAPCGILVDASVGALGLIRKDSISLFRSLDDMELLINGCSVEGFGDFGNSALQFSDLEHEILFEVLGCINNVGHQLGKAAPAAFFELLVASNNIPVDSSEDNIIPHFVKVLENRFSSSSDVYTNMPREKMLTDHKKMRKFSIDMILSLHALRKMAFSWQGVFNVIKILLKNVAPCKITHEVDSVVNLNLKSSVIVHATSQVAEVMFQFAFNVLLFLSFLVDISGLIDMSPNDKNHIQIELAPLIQEIMMQWVIIYFIGTTTCESYTVEDFSSQLSSLQIDVQIDKRSRNTELGFGKCDFVLGFILNSTISSENSLTCLPSPHSFISSVKSFASCVLWGDGFSDFFSHGTEIALLLLRHGQYDAVVSFIIIMDAYLQKEKVSRSFESSSGKWCTHFHVLGCCFLAQAHHRLHGFLKEKKLSHAIRCFFRASFGQGPLEAVKKLSHDIGLSPVLLDNVPGAAWKLQYFQWVMRKFEQFGMNEGAREFGLAALQQVDEAFCTHSDNDKESKIAVKGRLFADIFKYCLDLNSFSDAYWALASNPEDESKVVCLRHLVQALYEQGEMRALCDGKTIPFIGMADRVEQDLSWRAERSHIYANPSTYKLLYSFEIHRHNWRMAAYYMYRYSTRLKFEASVSDHQTLQERLNSLSTSINALHLVHPPYAWIHQPPFDNTHCYHPSKKLKSVEEASSSSSSSSCYIVDIEKLEKEFLLTSAEQSLFTANVKWSFNGVDPVPSDLVPLLIEMNFLDMAFTVILKFWKGSNLKSELEKVFVALSLKCWHEHLKLLPSASSMDENFFNVTSSISDWETLELYLGKYKHYHPTLPVTVAATLLRTDSQLELPLWLVNMFGGDDHVGMTGGEADPASLLRLYVEYGRYTEATNLVVGHMERGGSVRPKDLMRRKRAGAVWFPYTAIERLWCEVDGCESLKKLLREGVEKHLKAMKIDSDDAICCGELRDS